MAVAEQRPIGLAGRGIVRAARDKLVEKLTRPVVTKVGHEPAVSRECERDILMREPAERGVLEELPGLRIDLADVAVMLART